MEVSVGSYTTQCSWRVGYREGEPTSRTRGERSCAGRVWPEAPAGGVPSVPTSVRLRGQETPDASEREDTKRLLQRGGMSSSWSGETDDSSRRVLCRGRLLTWTVGIGGTLLDHSRQSLVSRGDVGEIRSSQGVSSPRWDLKRPVVLPSKEFRGSGPGRRRRLSSGCPFTPPPLALHPPPPPSQPLVKGGVVGTVKEVSLETGV